MPKTLIFAKDDSHADDIVRICREVFGKGNDFCQKITYRTGFIRMEEVVTDPQGQAEDREGEPGRATWVRTPLVARRNPQRLSQQLPSAHRRHRGHDRHRHRHQAAGDRLLHAQRRARKNFFEQMKGRGVRVVSDTEMEQVNPGIKRKTRYLIVDAVGVCERVLTESRPLEKKPAVSFEKLLDAAALGTTEVAAVESLAGRLIRLERRFDAEVEAEVVQAAKGRTLSQISKGMLAAIDPDEILAQAKAGPSRVLSSRRRRNCAKSATRASEQALAPLAANPDLRNLLKKVQKAADQTIDIISRDTLIYAGPAEQSTQTSAQLATSFRAYIEQHKAEITALQILYSRPYQQRLTEPMLKELEKKLRDNHAAWTEDRLWDAFAATAPAKVRGRSQAGRFADLVAARPLRAGTTTRPRPLRRLRVRAVQRMAHGQSESRRGLHARTTLPGCI